MTSTGTLREAQGTPGPTSLPDRGTLARPRPDGSARLLVASTEPVSVVDGPGARFTVFLQGCNLDCATCHNPTLIGPSRFARWRTVAGLVAELAPRAPFLRGVTVSGGEATLQVAGVAALFATVRADPRLAHLTTLVDSNGTLDTAGWHHLAPVMDGVLLDVKAVGADTHRRITGQGNRAVLASVRTLHRLDRLTEVRLVVIEGLTDTDEELARYAGFIASVDPAIPVRLLPFRHRGVRTPGRVWPETSAGTVAHVAATLRSHGLTDVRAPTAR